MTPINDQVVLITGAARGIGAATATELVRRGARVALIDVNEAGLFALADHLGPNAVPFVADVTDDSELRAAVAAAASTFGGLDSVVANAGISGPVSTVRDIDPHDFERVIDVNVIGLWRTIHASLPHVLDRNGYILAIASIAAAIPGVPTLAAYTASKHAVEGFARSLRMELASTGVAVGVAYFGLVRTDMLHEAIAGDGNIDVLPAAFRRAIPVGKASDAIVRGIEKRSKRVHAPWWVPGLLVARGAIGPAEEFVMGRPKVAARLQPTGGTSR